jgi:hypothetical protein
MYKERLTPQPSTPFLQEKQQIYIVQELELGYSVLLIWKEFESLGPFIWKESRILMSVLHVWKEIKC